MQADIAHAQSLGRGADRPQCFPGVDCSPALRGEDEARLNPDRGCLDPLGRLARLDPPKSATVAGERGTLRRKRSVLGSLMTRCPLTRETVPRTRRRLLVRSTSDQRRAQRLTPAQARGDEQAQQRRRPWRLGDQVPGWRTGPMARPDPRVGSERWSRTAPRGPKQTSHVPSRRPFRCQR